MYTKQKISCSNKSHYNSTKGLTQQEENVPIFYQLHCKEAKNSKQIL